MVNEVSEASEGSCSIQRGSRVANHALMSAGSMAIDHALGGSRTLVIAAANACSSASPRTVASTGSTLRCAGGRKSNTSNATAAPITEAMHVCRTRGVLAELAADDPIDALTREEYRFMHATRTCVALSSTRPSWRAHVGERMARSSPTTTPSTVSATVCLAHQTAGNRPKKSHRQRQITGSALPPTCRSARQNQSCWRDKCQPWPRAQRWARSPSRGRGQASSSWWWAEACRHESPTRT